MTHVCSALLPSVLPGTFWSPEDRGKRTCKWPLFVVSSDSEGGGRTRCNSSSISDFPTKINPNWLPFSLGRYFKNCHVSQHAPQSEITPGDGTLGTGVYRTTYVMKTWIDFMQNNIPDHLTKIFIFCCCFAYVFLQVREWIKILLK